MGGGGGGGLLLNCHLCFCSIQPAPFECNRAWTSDYCLKDSNYGAVTLSTSLAVTARVLRFVVLSSAVVQFGSAGFCKKKKLGRSQSSKQIRVAGVRHIAKLTDFTSVETTNNSVYNYIILFQLIKLLNASRF